MPTVTETTTIPSPADKVWPLLRDPALVASCIPGAALSPDQGDGVWRGSIRVKFGPTVAVFRGEATLAFDDAARTCTIEGRGIDGRGGGHGDYRTIVLAASDLAEGVQLIQRAFHLADLYRNPVMFVVEIGVVLTILFTIAVQRHLIRGLTFGAVKG